MNLHYEQKLDKDSEFYDYYDEYDEGEEYENTDSVIENLVSDDEMVDAIDEDVDEDVDEEFEDSLPTSLLWDFFEDEEYYVNFIPMKKKQRFSEIEA